MKILLLQPRQEEEFGLGGVMCLEPLGLEYIAAAVEPEHEVKLLDLFDLDLLARTLSSFQPDICAISCSFTMDVNRGLRLAEFVKRGPAKPLVVIGGHHASLTPEDFISDFVDFVVIGEGEVTFAELVSCLSRNGDPQSVPGLALNRDGAQFFTGHRGLVHDLDQLPIPARHLSKSLRKRYFLGFNYPVAMVETTRGCPYRCNFCSVHKFFQNRVRFKSAERVLEELATVNESTVLFADDNFLINIPRAQRIADLIKENGIKKRYHIQARSDTIVKHPDLVSVWKEIGLDGVFIGFEKIDEEGLKSVNKENTVENNEKALEILNSCGVDVVASFIVDPEETVEGFARLRRYVERLRLRTCLFTVLTPVPGTDLFTQVREKLVTRKHELFDGFHAVLPTKLSLPDFYGEFSKLYAGVAEHSAVGRDGLRKALSQIRSGRFSIPQLKRLSKAMKMATDPKCYLAGHSEIT